jgi:hypothetical protein
MSVSAKYIRLIFEFEHAEDAEKFLDTVMDDASLENLTITGKWSWGAEHVEQICFEYGDDNEND